MRRRARGGAAARCLLLARGDRDDGDAASTARSSGTVQDVYRSGGAEVYTVTGGPYGEFDVPGVRAFVRVFAPRRGEIVDRCGGARSPAAEAIACSRVRPTEGAAPPHALSPKPAAASRHPTADPPAEPPTRPGAPRP